MFYLLNTQDRVTNSLYMLSHWRDFEYANFIIYRAKTSSTKECGGYETRLHLMPRLYFRIFGECGVPLHGNYAQFHSDWGGCTRYGPDYESHRSVKNYSCYKWISYNGKLFVIVSKVGGRSRELHEGSLFNSYYTKV